MNQPVDDSSDSEMSYPEKLARFREYFTVEQDININVIPLESPHGLPSYEQFIRDMPYSFRIASEVSSIEASSLRPLRNLGNYGDDLVTYLKAQSRKIDLIMSYLLTMEDDDEYRLTANAYGGGGVSLLTDKEYAVGQLYKLKIFLSDEAAAIYCIGEVLSSEPFQGRFKAQLYYARIREDDREIIVRASLHQQSRQLKRIAQRKRQDDSQN